MTTQATDIKKNIATAVTNAVAKEEVPASVGSIVPITESVFAKLLPILLSITNNEKWYESRVTWAAIVGFISGILQLIGYVIEDDQQSQLVQIAFVGAPMALSLWAAAYTYYGRWKARKPLGS